MMRKGIKYISLLLTAVLLFAAFPPVVAQAARPRTFDKSKLMNANKQYPAELTIEDVVFHGVLKLSLDDGELDRLIEETMKEVGLTEEEFNRISEDHEDYKAREEELLKKLSDEVANNMSLQDPSVLKAVLQLLLQGDIRGALTTLLNANSTNSLVRTRRENSKLEMDLLKFAKEISSGVSKLASFYDKLHHKIREKMLWILEFKDAKAEKTFSLYGAQCKEQWTLNAILPKQMAATQSEDYPYGPYEGNFDIEIKYDLSGFHNNLETTVWDMPGMRDCYTAQTGIPGFSAPTATVKNRGTSDVKRNISGTAKVDVGVDRSWIDLTVKSNHKNAKVEGIVVNLHSDYILAYGTGNYDQDFNLSANAESFKAEDHIVIRTVHGGTTVGANRDEQHSLTAPWDGDIWQRGDKLKGQVSAKLKLSFNK